MNKSYFYVETAFHHEGDVAYLKALIQNAKNIGANGVKFQVLTDINDFVSVHHSAYNQLSDYCFTFEQWSDVFNYTKSLALDIILMPLNIDALALIDKFEIKYVDIHSVSFNDVKLLEAINQYDVDVVLAIGGRNKEEIEDKIKFYEDKVKVLMVGFQSFPSKLADVNLGKIAWLKDDFPNLIIGYADHSSFDDDYAISSNEFARLLGAEVFEKHVTLDEGVERVDYNSAVSFQKMKIIIDKVRFIEHYILIAKDQAYVINEKEEIYKNRQLVCVASKAIVANSVLNIDDISFKMVSSIENGITDSTELIGKVAKVNLKENSPILKIHLV